MADNKELSLDDQLKVDTSDFVSDEDQNIDNNKKEETEETDTEVEELKDENNNLKIEDTQNKIQDIQDSLNELSEDLKQLDDVKEVIEEDKDTGIDEKTAKTVTITVERIFNKYNKLLPRNKSINSVSCEYFTPSVRAITTESLLDSIKSAGKAAWEFIVKLIKALGEQLKKLYNFIFNRQKQLKAQSEKMSMEIKKVKKTEEVITVSFNELPNSFKFYKYDQPNDTSDVLDICNDYLFNFRNWYHDANELIKKLIGLKISESVETNPNILTEKDFNINIEEKIKSIGMYVKVDTLNKIYTIERLQPENSNDTNIEIGVNHFSELMVDVIKKYNDLINNEYQKFDSIFDDIINHNKTILVEMEQKINNLTEDSEEEDIEILNKSKDMVLELSKRLIDITNFYGNRVSNGLYSVSNDMVDLIKLINEKTKK